VFARLALTGSNRRRLQLAIFNGKEKLEFVQSSFSGFLGLLDGHPLKKQSKKKEGLNSYKVRFGACLVGSTATP
jgi:hypothetical protein